MARTATSERPVPPAPAYAYGEDLVLWAEEQVRLLRSGQLDRLDLESLAEEIADVGGSVRRELRSRTRTLVEHLCKLAMSSAIEPRRGWIDTVERTRAEVGDCLRDAPSLRRTLHEVLAEVGESGATQAARSLDRAGERAEATLVILRACDFTVEQVFGDWLPDDVSQPGGPASSE